MSKLVHEATGGREPGHLIRTCRNSATWVSVKESSNFLVCSGLEICIIESMTDGIDVGAKYGWFRIGNGGEGHRFLVFCSVCRYQEIYTRAEVESLAEKMRLAMFCLKDLPMVWLEERLPMLREILVLTTALKMLVMEKTWKKL